MQGQRALATKASTYIVGLDVDPDARNTLLGECRKILDAVQDIPAEAGFRKQTERLFGFYKHMCENQDIRENSELEQKVCEVLHTNHMCSFVRLHAPFRFRALAGDQLRVDTASPADR